MTKKRIVVVEDDEKYIEVMKNYLNQYFALKNIEVEIEFYNNTTTFIEEYTSRFDIIFMDIELPDGNGMKAIRRIRKVDNKVMVIFVTNMARYAVKGYEVEAFDFIVKPITYANFSIKLNRAMERLSLSEGTEIWIPVDGGKKRISSNAIKYVEVMKHVLIYHTTEGEYRTIGSMKAVCESLKGGPFELCNRCYLVNLAFVKGIWQFQIDVGGDMLTVSHLKRNEFVKKLNQYLSGDYAQ